MNEEESWFKYLKSLIRHKYAIHALLSLIGLFAIYVASVMLHYDEQKGSRLEKLIGANKQLLAELLPNFFAALVGSIVSIFVAMFLYEKVKNKLATQELYSSLVDAGMFEEIAKKMASVQSAGIGSVIDPTLKDDFVDLLRERMSAAKKGETILIVDNWLCSNRGSISSALQAGMEKALDNGVQVIVVLMHPNSPQVCRRAHLLNNGTDVKTAISRSIETLDSLFQRWLGSKKGRSKTCNSLLKVYCSDTYLSMQLYRFNGVSYLGFYSAEGTSFQTPQLEIFDKTDMGEMLAKQAQGILKDCAANESDYAVRVKVGFPGENEGLTAAQICKHVLKCHMQDLKTLSELAATSMHQNTLAESFLNALALCRTPIAWADVMAALDPGKWVRAKQSISDLLNVEQRVQRGSSEQPPVLGGTWNIDHINGKWWGYHLSRRNGQMIDSFHEYDLKVTQCWSEHECQLAGKFTEHAAEHPYEFQVEGRFADDDVTLIGRSGRETSVALFYNNRDRGRVLGIYVAHDFDNNPIVSPIIMTRIKLEAETARESMRSYGGFLECFLFPGLKPFPSQDDLRNV